MIHMTNLSRMKKGITKKNGKTQETFFMVLRIKVKGKTVYLGWPESL